LWSLRLRIINRRDAKAAEKNAELDQFKLPNMRYSIILLAEGVICGYRVEDIEDKLMQKIHYLDKLVDELVKGKTMEKILRS
jgi:hypothetical protein